MTKQHEYKNTDEIVDDIRASMIAAHELVTLLKENELPAEAVDAYKKLKKVISRLVIDEEH